MATAKQSTIYMDHAAATPIDPAVLRAMQPYFTDNFYNPSATYPAALKTRHAIDAARAGTAHWLGARPTEIIFTAGGTEANNLAIHGVMKQFPKGNVVISSIEHESVLRPAGNYDYRLVKVEPDGRINLDDLKQKIDPKTVLVSVMYANNEIGTIQPIREIAKIITAKRLERLPQLESPKHQTALPLPLYLHTDACQAANYLDLHVSRLGVDLLTLNAGKIYGPKQSGALYIKGGVSLVPLIDGGGQERGLRSGTENVAAAVGLAAALDRAQSMRKPETARLQGLQQDFIRLLKSQLPQTIINGSTKRRLPNNIHLTLRGQDNERLLMLLDQTGIMAAAGSACSASNEPASHVLGAIGLSDAAARSSLRFTMGRSTNSAIVEQTVMALSTIA